MVDYQRMFHQGVRVPSLTDAMDELGGTLGVIWASVQEREQPIWTPSTGLVNVHLKFTYSCEGPQHIELLEGAAGSFWDGSRQPGVHHVGVWSSDVKGQTEAFVAAGWTLVGAGAPPEQGYGFYTYVQPPTGLVVELVNDLALPRFESWWAGGSLG